MVNKKSADGVGKKIVDALKQQSDIEITTAETEEQEFEEPVKLEFNTDILPGKEEVAEDIETPKTDLNFTKTNDSHFTTANEDSINDLSLPSNIAVLKQLVAKLPSGVSKQTGAQIIKQTMEALGVSMTALLQEAQQVQENLNQSVIDCQNSILEYKKQINTLESQSKKYQRQYAAINDVISLFIQTNF